MKFLKNLFSFVPSPFNLAQHDSATLKAMQGKMLKHQFFAGLLHHSHSPVFVDPHKGLVLQDSAQVFEQLASIAIQARLKGYRVIWLNAQQSVQAIDELNAECEQVMDLRGFVPCDLADNSSFVGQTDSLFMARVPRRVTSSPKAQLALGNLLRYLAHYHNTVVQPEVDSSVTASGAYAQKGEPFIILQGFSLQSLTLVWEHLSGFLRAGAYAWVATAEQLEKSAVSEAENSSFLEAHARYRIGVGADRGWIVDTLDDLGTQPFDVGVWETKGLLGFHKKDYYFPSSVFEKDSPNLLCWVGSDPERMNSYLAGLLKHSCALDGVFKPNLAVEPHFVRDNKCSQWHYDIQGNRVIPAETEQLSEFDVEPTAAQSPCWISQSMIELSELMFWVYEVQCPALFEAADAQNLRSKVQAYFYEQANLLYRNSKAVSFNAVALLFSNVLRECGIADDPLHTPRFEELPVLLKTLIWLQAYRLALPKDAPWQVLGVCFEEALDVLTPLSPAAYRCLAYLVRASRAASICYFLPILPEQYAKALTAFEQGPRCLQSTQSLMGILQVHFATLFQVDELEPTT